MLPRYRTLVLHWLKVPPEPHPPAGAPGSLRVFRAGKNFWNLRLLGWAIPQALALVGIVFWTIVLLQIEEETRALRATRAATATASSAPTPPPASDETKEAAPPAGKKAAGKSARKRVRITNWSELKQATASLALVLPPWSFPLIWALKVGGVLLYLVQIPFTFAVRRLDYEMRWYVVTDRSLRIRTGIWRVQELTMSFANLQKVEVTRGPIQSLLGLGDVHVQSAGGGGGGAGAQKGQHDSLHTAVFHGVENATEIRDLILERLRRFRATGLGDPDDHPDARPPAATHVSPELLRAAHALLAEARALRQSLAK